MTPKVDSRVASSSTSCDIPTGPDAERPLSPTTKPRNNHTTMQQQRYANHRPSLSNPAIAAPLHGLAGEPHQSVGYIVSCSAITSSSNQISAQAPCFLVGDAGGLCGKPRLGSLSVRHAAQKMKDGRVVWWKDRRVWKETRGSPNRCLLDII